MAHLVLPVQFHLLHRSATAPEVRAGEQIILPLALSLRERHAKA